MTLNRKRGTVLGCLSLRPSLALMLLFMIFCGGQGASNPSSAQAGPDENSGLSSEGINSGQDPVSGQFILKSRVKRKALEFKSHNFRTGATTIPGIAPERQAPLTVAGGYEDGKSCETGQEPWNEQEAKLAKAMLITQFGGEENFKATFIDEITIEADVVAKCKSGKCYVDGQTWTHICGSPKFEDGKTCTLGVDPRSESNVDSAERLGYDALSPLKKAESENEMTKQVNGFYGENCKNKKCYMSFSKMSVICGTLPVTTTTAPSSAHTMTPLSILVAWLCGLSVFLISSQASV